MYYGGDVSLEVSAFLLQKIKISKSILVFPYIRYSVFDKLQTFKLQDSEAYSESIQTSKIELLAKNLTIFAKRLIFLTPNFKNVIHKNQSHIFVSESEFISFNLNSGSWSNSYFKKTVKETCTFIRLVKLRCEAPQWNEQCNK